MLYTCRLCGHANDEDEVPMDYFLDGFACVECIEKLNEEEDDSRNS